MTDEDIFLVRLLGSTPACDVPLEEWREGDQVWHPSHGHGVVVKDRSADIRHHSIAVLWDGFARPHCFWLFSEIAKHTRRLPRLGEENSDGTNNRALNSTDAA